MISWHDNCLRGASMPPGICLNRACRRTYNDTEESWDGRPPRFCEACGIVVMGECPWCHQEFSHIPFKGLPYGGNCGCNLLSVEIIPDKEPPQLPQQFGT